MVFPGFITGRRRFGLINRLHRHTISFSPGFCFHQQIGSFARSIFHFVQRPRRAPVLLTNSHPPAFLPPAMASDSRAREADHDPSARGAGRKILRGRRTFSPTGASLYYRPVETASLSSSPPRSRRWFSGIVSGAGRLISSVFRSEDDASPCSSSNGSESGIDGESDKDAADDAGEKGEFQPSTNLQLIEDPSGDRQPIASISGDKLAIERLLQQETYTRNEGIMLIEIIRSRIVDSSKIEDEGGTRLLEFPAVMEAKKWVEQKRIESTSEVDLSFQHFALNTELLHHVNEYDKESPVNMARSYMQSLPAWESPLARSSGFNTAFGSSSRPSLTPMKRDGVTLGSWDALERSRNVRQKISKDFSGKFGPYDRMQDGDLQTKITTERTMELPPQVSHLSLDEDPSEPVAKVPLGASSGNESSFSNILSAAEVHAKMLNSPVDNGYYYETDNSFYKDTFSTLKESLAANRRDEPLAGALWMEAGSPAPEKELDIILLSKEQDGSIVPNKTGVLNSSFVESKGFVDHFTDAEPIAMEPENMNLELPSPVDSSLLEKSGETKPVQSGHFAVSEAAVHADVRSRQQNETSPLGTHFTHNSGSSPSSSSAGSEKVDPSTQTLNLNHHSSIGTSNGDLGVELNDFHKPLTKAAIKRKHVRAMGMHKESPNTSNPIRGIETRTRRINEMLKESPNSSSPSHDRETKTRELKEVLKESSYTSSTSRGHNHETRTRDRKEMPKESPNTSSPSHARNHGKEKQVVLRPRKRVVKQ